MATTLNTTAAQALARADATMDRIGLPQAWCRWGKRGAQQSVGTTNDCCYAVTYWTQDRRGADSELRNGSIRAFRADRRYPEPLFHGPDNRRNVTAQQILAAKIRPGDLVCFRWSPAAGDGLPDHIGMVVRVRADGYVITREANTGPRPGVSVPCGTHERVREPGVIVGFIRPPYQPAHAAPKPAPAVSHRTYTVRDGDTLIAVGARVKVSWTTIAHLNGIAAPYVIHPKDVLRLN
jgi:hypothetical protein